MKQTLVFSVLLLYHSHLKTLPSLLQNACITPDQVCQIICLLLLTKHSTSCTEITCEHLGQKVYCKIIKSLEVSFEGSCGYTHNFTDWRKDIIFPCLWLSTSQHQRFQYVIQNTAWKSLRFHSPYWYKTWLSINLVIATSLTWKRYVLQTRQYALQRQKINSTSLGGLFMQIIWKYL